MNITLTMSHTTHRSLVVGCCMNPCNLQSALSTSSVSHVGRFNPTVMDLDMTKERIRKMFRNVELSVSSYDTAWVAMVPSPKSPKSPCFPECLKWLMDNQLNDGSWCLVHDNPPFSLLKDSLSSTLASILALKRWNIAADDQINKGLCFIESNIGSATDKNQPSPLGFDIIFPHMLEYAKQLNITLPVKQTDLSLMLHQRELELTRCHSKDREAYLSYVSEGLGNFYDQNIVMKYQMKNGSILNSPSATAAALIHHHDATSLDYLTSLVKKFGNAVPTLYPLDLYLRLYMVEELERLGISRHFKMEIQTVLDETYRYWMQRDEQIFMDVGTCALAFRVLRTNGYQISSDPLDEISQLEEPFKDVNEALEAYRASQIIYQDELSFGTLSLRSADFLKQKIITSSNRLSKFHQKEVVEDALKFPLSASLERVSVRRYIKHYNVHDSRMLKTTYRSSNISNKDYLRLAVEDYNACQFIYRRELKDFERWVEHNELDKLKFARQKAGYCYFSAISIFPSPEQLDARMSFAKSSMLAIVMDDFFDVGGSMDEYANLVHCVEKWDVNVDNDCCSEDVRIMFLALKDAVTWTGDTAFKLQGRDVTSHVKETWLRLIKSNLTEAKWVNDGRVPTLNEYMETAHVSFTLGALVFPALYFIGPKLSEEIVQSAEFHTLFKLMSTHGRLLNDIRTFQRELKAGRINAVTLQKNYGKGGIEDEEIIKEIELSIEDQEKKLLQLVLEEKESIVPGACKDAFWKMCNVINFFYATHDGFTANDILESVKEVIYEPVVSVRADR